MRLTWDQTWMGVAEVLSQRSSATKRKVGAVAIFENELLGVGYNGTPPGTDNSCEDENNKTYPHVIHAEMNLCRKGIDLSESTVYVTCAPCAECAWALTAAGVNRVVYRDDYKNTDGIEWLRSRSVEVSKL